MNMYENSGYYDPPHVPNFEFDIEDAAAIGLEHNLGFVDDIIDMPPPVGPANWEPACQVQQYDHHAAAAAYGANSDLMNLLQLPRGTIGSAFPVLPGAAGSVCFDRTSIWNEDGSMLYDPYSSLPPQNYGMFCGVEEREAAIGGVFGEDGNNVMEYRRGGEGLMGKGEGKGNFVTERERRQQLNEKYTALRRLIPNPTKNDRATIVGDAIEYVKELLRTVEELKIVAQKKKKDGKKMLKSEEDSSTSMRAKGDDRDRSTDGVLRSSWLQRKSKDSFVDVRIVDDEVNIKLNQKKKPNCLMYVAKVLEELQLDLVHVSGGNIGDSYVFMLNTKICEGSSVYAGAIAKKLLEVMDRQYPSLDFPANY